MFVVVFTVGMILGTIGWVAAPLIRKGPAAPAAPSDERSSDLVEAKQAALRSILDLDFDRKMEKVSEEDYRLMRGQYEAEVLEILAELHTAGWAADALEVEIAAARDRLRR